MAMTSEIKVVVELDGVPDLEGRRKVLAALEAFDAVEARRSAATKSLWETRRKLEAAQRKIDLEIRKIDRTFDDEMSSLESYPDIDSPYQMHDDHLGCYRCEISGLPLRHDDETVEWGDGEALACLARKLDAEVLTGILGQGP